MKKIFLIIFVLCLVITNIFSLFYVFKYKNEAKGLNNQVVKLSQSFFKTGDEFKNLSNEETADLGAENGAERIYSIDEELKKCISKDYTTSGMNSCTYAGVGAWEKQIKEYSVKIQRELPKNEVALFEASQKDWDNYYQKEQKLLNNTIFNKPGTIHTNITAGLVYDLVKAHALNLEAYYKELVAN